MHNEKENEQEKRKNKKKKTQKNKKKRSTTKRSDRCSGSRSSSRHFRTCQTYVGKTPRIIRNVDILVVIVIQKVRKFIQTSLAV